MFWAARLGPRTAAAKALPRLLAFTDPARTPDPAAVLARLPRGAALVFRAFGTPDAKATARRLRALAGRRGVRLFIGADVALAASAGAHGLHLPERLTSRRGMITAASRRFVITAAAHSLPAIRQARAAGARAVVVSPVFASASVSAGPPLGVLRFVRLVRAAKLPVYALGGIDIRTVRRLAGSGAAGIAAVDAFAEPAKPTAKI